MILDKNGRPYPIAKRNDHTAIVYEYKDGINSGMYYMDITPDGASDHFVRRNGVFYDLGPTGMKEEFKQYYVYLQQAILIEQESLLRRINVKENNIRDAEWQIVVHSCGERLQSPWIDFENGVPGEAYQMPFIRWLTAYLCVQDNFRKQLMTKLEDMESSELGFENNHWTRLLNSKQR